MKKQRKPEEKENCERLLRNVADYRLARSPTASPEIKEKNPEELLHALQVHQIELEMQNEELRKVQLALEESRQRYADLYDFAPVGYFTFTQEALIKEVNLTGSALLGMARQKLINARFRRMVAAKNQDRWDQHFLGVLQQGEKQTCELTLKRQDGSTFQASLESIRLEVNRGALEIHTAITDITERKRAEEELRKSEEKFSNLFDNAAGGVFQATPEGRVVIVNRVFARMFGYESPEEVINTITDITRQIYANSDDRKMIGGILKEMGYLRNYECQMQRKDGCIFWGSINARIAETVDNIPCIEGLIIDVSERKRSEEELRESEKRYRDLYDFLPIPVYEMDFEANITSANRAIYETFRGTEEDLKKGFKGWQLLSPEDIDKSRNNIEHMLKGEQVEGTEYTFMRLDGSAFPAIVIASLIYSDGKPVGIRGAVVDITERKQAEKSLRESEELFKSYLEHAPDGVYMSDLEGNFLYGNRKAEEIIGYRREELIGKSFLEVNILSEKSLNKAVQLLQANTEGRGTGPDEIDLISKGGRLIPVEINTNVVQHMGQNIVLSFVRDITERKRAEEKLSRTLENLRKAMGGIIQVISGTVETRDPYTAGHQRRVTDLARAIAQEMGLSDDQRDGLRMAGTIHDLGKVSIPAEILSKPTKLNEIEYQLIQAHSQIGYDILKGIEFPWPIADMVLQHHERMNGSGYPRGLKGEAISLEARILMVADVVEAMASYRPYRPALGIDAALEEIEKNKGILYDQEVAEVCLRLFKEKGFRFE